MVKRLFYIFIVSSLLMINGCSERVPDVPSPFNVEKQDTYEYIENKEYIKEQNTDKYIEELSIKEAWGEIPIIQKEFFMPRVHYSISESGELLSGEQDEPVDYNYELDTTLLIADIYSDFEEIIKEVKWPNQIWNAEINSEWVIWVEGIAVGISCTDYKVYGYNRKTKDIRLCFTAPVDNEGNKIIAHTPKPALRENEFLIDVVSAPNEDGYFTITSRKYNLKDGSYENIVEQFALPSWSQDGYIGMTEDKESPRCSIMAKYISGNINPLMEKGLYIHDYVTDGKAVAIIAQEFDSKSKDEIPMERDLWLIEGGAKKLIRQAELGGGCAWPSMSKRFITWNDLGKGYAYDRNMGVIIKLFDEYNSYAQFTNNNYLVWSTPTEIELKERKYSLSVLNIIEINHLP